MSCREVIEKKVLARKHTLETFDEPSTATFVASGGFDSEARGHRDHRSHFAGKRLVGLEHQFCDSGRGSRKKFILHLVTSLRIRRMSLCEIGCAMGHALRRASERATPNLELDDPLVQVCIGPGSKSIEGT